MTIQIRRTEVNDFKALQQIHAQPKAMAGTLQMPFPSEELWKQRLSHPPENFHTLVACIENEVVGTASLRLCIGRRRHVASLGISIHDQWHGKGIGTALMQALLDLADNWLNLTRIELTVYTDNEPALALYKKFGFAIEGTHRQYAFRNGEYVDSYCMARLR